MSLELIVGGLFVLVLFMGLQVGTVGLVGRDAIWGVISDMTLLVFSARTMPVSRRRLLFVFLFKNLLYYVALFLTPIAVGFFWVVVDGRFTAGEVALLWVTIADTFALGVGASLALAGITIRSRLAVIGVVTGVAAGIALELLLGVVVFPLLSLYVFGLTAYLTGLSPNELLFNTPLFAVYSAGLMLVAVPLLIAALAFDEWPLVAAGLAGVAGLAGFVLARRTGPGWHDRLRTES